MGIMPGGPGGGGGGGCQPPLPGGGGGGRKLAPEPGGGGGIPGGGGMGGLGPPWPPGGGGGIGGGGAPIEGRPGMCCNQIEKIIYQTKVYQITITFSQLSRARSFSIIELMSK